jgi:hypothetical protein
VSDMVFFLERLKKQVAAGLASRKAGDFSSDGSVRAEEEFQKAVAGVAQARGTGGAGEDAA